MIEISLIIKLQLSGFINPIDQHFSLSSLLCFTYNYLHPEIFVNIILILKGFFQTFFQLFDFLLQFRNFIGLKINYHFPRSNKSSHYIDDNSCRSFSISVLGEERSICRITIKARIICIFISIAISLLRTEESGTTPCSVNAKGIYRTPLLFEVLKLHLKLLYSSYVILNI